MNVGCTPSYKTSDLFGEPSLGIGSGKSFQSAHRRAGSAPTAGMLTWFRREDDPAAVAAMLHWFRRRGVAPGGIDAAAIFEMLRKVDDRPDINSLG